MIRVERGFPKDRRIDGRLAAVDCREFDLKLAISEGELVRDVYAFSAGNRKQERVLLNEIVDRGRRSVLE
jgi:hypothetical protein